MCEIEDIQFQTFSKSIATECEKIRDLTKTKTHETDDVIQVL